ARDTGGRRTAEKIARRRDERDLRERAEREAAEGRQREEDERRRHDEETKRKAETEAKKRFGEDETKPRTAGAAATLTGPINLRSVVQEADDDEAPRTT